MAYIVYHMKDGTEKKAYFQCSVCGEPCDQELYICNAFVSEKACHICGPEQGMTKVVNATFFTYMPTRHRSPHPPPLRGGGADE